MATEAVDTPKVEEVEVGETAEQASAEPVEAKPAEPVEEGYDASLLVFVKGKAKRPARPDDAERNMQVQKLQEQIDKASARINEIKAILDSRGSSRGVVNPEVQACRDKVQQLRAEFDTVLVRLNCHSTAVLSGRPAYSQARLSACRPARWVKLLVKPGAAAQARSTGYTCTWPSSAVLLAACAHRCRRSA
jgi:hypothetical protein